MAGAGPMRMDQRGKGEGDEWKEEEEGQGSYRCRTATVMGRDHCCGTGGDGAGPEHSPMYE
jgi:hypothetical protein